jgi:hypothetical protein
LLLLLLLGLTPAPQPVIEPLVQVSGHVLNIGQVCTGKEGRSVMRCQSYHHP